MITPSQRYILSPFYDRSNSSRTHYSSLSMVRSSVLTHTLTGYIYEASPQSHTIMTTHDLSAFLCSIMESTRHSSNAKQDKTNSDGVHHGISPSISIYEESSRSSQPNKSCLISFTSFPQSSQTRDTDFPPENYYCILRINGCKITLERPYEGPSVVKGVPKVVMRTNLLPSSAAASKKDATGNISSIALTTHPTIVRVHPQLPYLFVGHIDDSLCIITPESYCN